MHQQRLPDREWWRGSWGDREGWARGTPGGGGLDLGMEMEGKGWVLQAQPWCVAWQGCAEPGWGCSGRAGSCGERLGWGAQPRDGSPGSDPSRDGMGPLHPVLPPLGCLRPPCRAPRAGSCSAAWRGGSLINRDGSAHRANENKALLPHGAHGQVSCSWRRSGGHRGDTAGLTPRCHHRSPRSGSPPGSPVPRRELQGSGTCAGGQAGQRRCPEPATSSPSPPGS